MNKETENVGQFFDQIAAGYRNKYDEKDVFRNYFFNERLDEAVADLDLKGKTVLDVGAGTGNLYDRLIQMEPFVDYFAIDIAKEMLEHSLIPKNRRFVGEFGVLELPVKKFDYIFFLGVTTYMDAEKWKAQTIAIRNSLKDNGKAIITFTNENSLDWKVRRFARKFLKYFSRQKTVLTQDFAIHPRRLEDVIDQLPPDLKISEVSWLNHTIFPLNQIFDSSSVALAKKYHVRSGKSREFLSSDFLIKVLKR